MAIDSKTKRINTIRMLGPFMIHAIPVPDGTIAQIDRQHVAGSYGGILSSLGIVPLYNYIVKSKVFNFLVKDRTFNRTVNSRKRHFTVISRTKG